MPRRFNDDDRDDDDREEERPRRRRRDDDDDSDDRGDRRSRRRRDDDEEDYDDRDRRGRRRYAEEPTNGPATTAMILGVLSLVGGITAIPGLICGFAGLSKAKKLGGAGKGMAVTGTVLSGVGLIVLGLTIWLVIWWMGKRGETQERMIANNNLKQIGIGMHNHHDVFQGFNTGVARSPGAFNPGPIRDSELPNKLSWRVEILPYIEQDRVYRQMNLSEPWDGPSNRRHADTPITQYSDVDARTDPATRWRTFYGEGTPFNPMLPQQRLGITSIMDGTSNTIMVAESGQKVTWTKFDEIKFDRFNPPAGATFGRPNRPTFQALMFDGSVREIRKTVSPQTLSAAITHQGGEVVFDLDR